MLTLASWKEKEKWRGKLMRISRYPEFFLPKAAYNWGVVPCLIPDWELVKSYRKGKVSAEEFSTAYLRGLEEHWGEVSSWLSSLSADEDLTLLCHEEEGKFCHRILVDDLVTKHRPNIHVELH